MIKLLEYTKSKTGYFSIGLHSMDNDSTEHNFFMMRLGKHFWLFALPNIIKPVKDKRYFTWLSDEEMQKRKDRGQPDWYYNIRPREYGITLFENHLSIRYGVQEGINGNIGDGKRWSCFLPWNEWKFIKHSYYDLGGNWFADEPKKFSMETRDSVPKKIFKLFDYDGEEIEATVYIESREWHKGTGWFSWIKYFVKPKIRRNLDISFNKETGKRKNSWKGGTIGSGEDYIHNFEHIHTVLKRYCDKHDMVLLDDNGYPVPPNPPETRKN